jgi:hypothetical protein
MLQLYKDSLSKDSFQVALGGVVDFTVLFSNPEYVCSYFTLMKFRNYQE